MTHFGPPMGLSRSCLLRCFVHLGAGPRLQSFLHHAQYASNWVLNRTARLVKRPVTNLTDENLSMLAAPGLRGRKPVREPADFEPYTLVQHTARSEAWNQCLEATGTQSVNGLEDPRFELTR